MDILLKQRYFHEQRKNQCLKARLQAVGRRSHRTSKESTASNDSVQSTVNSGLRFSQSRKSSKGMTKSACNDRLSPAVIEKEEDVQSTVNSGLRLRKHPQTLQNLLIMINRHQHLVKRGKTFNPQ